MANNNNNRLWPRFSNFEPEDQPVLGENRGRMISYDAGLALRYHSENNMFAYFKQNGYELIGEIGRGGYGVAFKVRSIHDVNKVFAIKVNFDVVARSTIFMESAFFHLFRKKPNLPKIYDLFYHNNTPHIVLEYFEHQPYIELFEEMKTIKEIKHYIFEMLKGVRTLKDLGIYHRDIKPQNFLYNRFTRKGVIIDYGLAEVDKNFYETNIVRKYEDLLKKIKKRDRNSHSELAKRKEERNLYKKLIKAQEDHGTMKIGTEAYVTVDSLLRVPHQGHECEVWSVGVVFGQFLIQKLHFFNEVKVSNNEEKAEFKFVSFFVMELCRIFGSEAVSNYLKKIGWNVKFPKDMPEKGDIKEMICLKNLNREEFDQSYDLLMKMICLNAEERITVEDAIWHPFFDDIREDHYKGSPKELSRFKKEEERRKEKNITAISSDEESSKSSVGPLSNSKSHSKSKQTKKKESEEEHSHEENNDEIKTNKEEKLDELLDKYRDKQNQFQEQEDSGTQIKHMDIQEDKKVNDGEADEERKVELGLKSSFLSTIETEKPEESKKVEKVERIIIDSEYIQPANYKKVQKKINGKPEIKPEIKPLLKREVNKVEVKTEKKTEKNKHSIQELLQMEVERLNKEKEAKLIAAKPLIPHIKTNSNKVSESEEESYEDDES